MSVHTRQLVAIMFTDVVGYTALMGNDEHKAMAILKSNRETHKNSIKKHHGKWLKEMGDGTLASFQTASDAVYCAGEILRLSQVNGITLRIGIHLGEVMKEEGDIFGNGVNVASRIESLAEENHIFISEPIHQIIKNKHGITSTFIGEKQLKNVVDPVRVFSVEVLADQHGTGDENKIPKKRTAKKIRLKHVAIIILSIISIAIVSLLVFKPWSKAESAIDNTHLNAIEPSEIKKSIAVLPFKDMSPDQDQEYLGDGIAEEIINRLVNVNDLKVIGRTSSFSFKHKNADLKTIGELLGVDLILEGSVQKSGNRLRITAQLINTENGIHIWSDRFDREATDLFSLQDELSKLVVSKIDLATTKSNQIVTNHYDPDPESYEFFLKGRFIMLNRYWLTYSNEDFKLIERLFLKSIELDSAFALPHAGLADLYISYIYHIIQDKDSPEYQRLLNQSKEHLKIAYILNPESDYVNNVKGEYYSEVLELDSAYSSYLMAIQINPKDPDNFLVLAQFIEIYFGLSEEAILLVNRAIDIDPLNIHALYLRANNYFGSGKLEKARVDAEEVLRLSPDYKFCDYILVNINVLKGDFEKAEMHLEEFKSKTHTDTASDFDVIWLKAWINAGKGFKEKLPEGYNSSPEFLVLLGKYEEAIAALLDQSDFYSYYRLLNSPHLEQIREDPAFRELLESKKEQHENLRSKYGNLDFIGL